MIRGTCTLRSSPLRRLGPLLLVAACAGSTTAPATRGPAPTTAPTTATTALTALTATVTGNVTVLAAASLTGSFGAAKTAFEAANPGATVTLSFGASSTLATQVVQGAPADVFASADQANMAKVTGPGLTAGTPVVFATNRLAIIVAKGNPKGIAALTDLARPDLAVVLAGPDVPAGKYARQVLDAAKVAVTPKSLEADVKAVVSKVTLGEADAGIVYTTDVQAAGTKAEGVAIPDGVNVLASYPVAVLKDARNAGAAQAFVAFLTSDAGRAILTGAGFGTP
jgi:molybdate transport system substrate-binding protein